MTATRLLSPRAIHATAMAGLCLVIWLTYWPALRHLARDDQWTYFAVTCDHHRFKHLIANYYVFNRTSLLMRGDYPLFRPVLCGLLATEKALFGHRFVWWQAVGIAVHCTVVCLFLTLLLRLARLAPISDGFPAQGLRTLVAYALALFFAVNVAIMELVIYHHLTGYMVFLACELGVLVLVVDLLADPNRSPRGRLARIAGAFLLALVAAFTYEIGQFFAVVVGLVLGAAAWHERRRSLAVALTGLFCSVLVLFQLADRGDRLIHPPRTVDLRESDVLAQAWTPTTLKNAGRYLAFCVAQPFFPSCIDVGLASRLVVPEPADRLANYTRFHPLLAVSLLVVAGVCMLTAGGFRRLRDDPNGRARLMVALLAAALVLLHMSIIVLGRMNMRPRPTVLSMNSYYAYFPLAMLLVGLYALWGSGVAAVNPRVSRPTTVVQLAVAAGLLVLSAVSVGKVHAMNVQIAEFHQPLRDIIAFFDRLEQENRGRYFAMAFAPNAYRRFQSLSTTYRIPRLLPFVLYTSHLDYTRATHFVYLFDDEWHVCAIERIPP